MVKILYSLINLQHRSQILICLAQNYKGKTLALFSTQQQSIFFKDAIQNIGYRSIDTLSFENYDNNHLEVNQYSSIVIMDIPQSLELLKKIIEIDTKQSSLILLLGSKKIQLIELVKMEYSTRKFYGINGKLKQLIQLSYQLNREAFYAYGSYLINFRKNMLKTIFKTQLIDVHALARGFGFDVAPRVKQGSFLTEKARKDLKKQKSQQKIANKKLKESQKDNEENKIIPKIKKIKKIK